MKANSQRQIESIIKKSFSDMIKLFLVCFFMNNPILYIGFFPTVKNTKHFSLFSYYPYKQNLKAIGIQFMKLFYIDFSYSDFSQSIVIFVSINCFKYYMKKHYFIGFKIFRLIKIGAWKSNYILKNQNGFISWEMINTFSIWFFRFIISFLIAAIFSFSDIDLDRISYQGFLNDMQYPIELVQKVFNK